MLDKKLLAYIGSEKNKIFIVTLLNILGLIFNVSITTCLLLIIYSLISANNVFVYGLLGLLISLTIKIVLTTCSTKIATNLADYVVAKLRNDTYAKYLAINGNTPFSVNEMAQLSTEGIEQLRLYYSIYLPSFFYAMIAPILLFILFLFLNYQVAILYLICIPLIPISIIAVSKWAKKIFAKYWNIYISLGDSFLDSIGGMKELKIFSYDEIKQKEMYKNSEKFRKITMKVLTMQLASITIMDLVAFGGAGVGIVLSLVALRNGLNLYIVLFMILIGAEFFLPLRALGSAFHVAMNGATAGKKVLQLLEIEEEKKGQQDLNKISSLQIKNLSFSYDDKQILTQINLDLKVGFNSIVGLSGSGKSTLAKICMRIRNNYSGTIKINDENSILTYKENDFYRRACYISNNTYLFHDSIRNLFKFYDSEITEEKIYALLSKVKLMDFITNNGGLDFKINPNSTNLSGGEKQRLILALYLAKDYDFYIFDEATSNIDIESEEIIVDIIKKIAKTKVVLFITHRLKNVFEADYIYFLENTQIIEEGTIDTLLKNNFKFANLLKKQQEMEAH